MIPCPGKHLLCHDDAKVGCYMNTPDVSTVLGVSTDSGAHRTEFTAVSPGAFECAAVVFMSTLDV